MEALSSIEINSKTYCIRTMIGEGGYAKLYEVYDVISKKTLALKISYDKPHLFQEFQIYKHLHEDSLANEKGIPQIIDYQEDEKKGYLLMQLLGLSVEAYMENIGLKPDLRFTIELGYQMLNLIEYIHSRGIVHRDLSPSNFLFGLNKEKEKLFLVDFGLSKKYLLDNGDHIPFNSYVPFVGNTRFCSKFTSGRLEYCRREELASLCYILIFVMKGSLPWDNFEPKDPLFYYYYLAIYKANIDEEELYGDIQLDFRKLLNDIFHHAYSTMFQEKPDYDFCRKKFIDIFEKLGYGDLKEKMKNI